MRIMHLFLIVFLAAIMLAAGRDTVGRVAMVVFFTGLAEFIVGTVAVMTLFQTVGSIGHARGLIEYAQAIAATAFVLLAATITMNLLLWIGIQVLRLAVGDG